MQVIINELSFRYILYSQKEALSRFMLFIGLCHELESGRLKNVERLAVAGKIDTQFEIVPGFKIIKLIQEILPVEERRYLISVLMNRPVIEEAEYPFICDGQISHACAAAKEDAVISLLSADLFSGNVIIGKIKDSEVSVKNISKEEHIDYHRKLLGKRIYRGNQEKHKRDKINYYGKGKAGSPMDLDEAQGQNLLDKAVEYKGRLYGRAHGRNYSFQCEQDVYYHGYIDDNLGDDVKKILDKYEWEN